MRFLIATILLLSAACAGAGTSNNTGRSTVWLDGRNQSFLVVGYSTSYAWPAMLQQMLDEHHSGKRIYHVLNSVIGGAPVEIWIGDEGSDSYERTIVPMQRDFLGSEAKLRGAAPEPRVAICQTSLQFTGEELFGDRRGPVKTETDMVGAELGADVMEKMSLRLRDNGLEQVIIAMHIYKEPIEPEVGNERIALARLLTRGHNFIHGGPDLWRITRDCHPGCFTEDGVHPNEQGMKLMAEAWYRTLAGNRAKEDVIANMHRRSYDVDAMMRQYLAWRRGEGPAPTPIYR